jgi:uroporphyrinogen-III synthase
MGQFPGLRLASIGPETTKALSGLGIRTVAEASIHTIDGLVRAVQQAALKDGREKQRHQG